MPELPEVETTKTSLMPLVGQTVRQTQVTQPSLRWQVPDDLQRLQGQALQALTRRAKYILAQFERDALLLHLGMSGSLRIGNPHDQVRKHDHVFIQFDHAELRYHDPRRFGCVLWLDDVTEHKLLGHLAPEPLTDAFDAAYLMAVLAKRSTGIKVCLMDQRLVVGVGNIYATEVLFKCRIHPAQAANTLNAVQIAMLVDEIKIILDNAIALGGSTLKDFVNAQGENGYFQQTLTTYGRAKLPCSVCHQPLSSIVLAQRASVYCEDCQALQ